LNIKSENRRLFALFFWALPLLAKEIRQSLFLYMPVCQFKSRINKITPYLYLTIYMTIKGE